MQVIGVGFGRTGTESLKVALEELGYKKSFHTKEMLQNADIMEMWYSNGFSSHKLLSWKSQISISLCNMALMLRQIYGHLSVRTLMTTYPDAKFILTTSRVPELGSTDGLGQKEIVLVKQGEQPSIVTIEFMYLRKPRCPPRNHGRTRHQVFPTLEPSSGRRLCRQDEFGVRIRGHECFI